MIAYVENSARPEIGPVTPEPFWRFRYFTAMEPSITDLLIHLPDGKT